MVGTVETIMVNQREREAVRAILQHVGDKQRQRQSAVQKATRRVELDHRDNQLVTDVDRWSEQYLRDSLTDVRDVPVVGEERGDDRRDECWIVDPLDGTLNYAHGTPHYAVSVGFYDRGIKAGFLYFPELDTYAEAIDGEAFIDEQPVSVSDCPAIEQAAVALGYGNIRKETNFQFRQDALAADARHVVRYGAATYQALLIARGALDGYFETLEPWDVAAGGYLIECAGGTIEGFSTDEWIEADCHVMSNGRLQKQLRQYINQQHIPL